MKLRHLAIMILLTSMALAQNQYAIGLDGSESFYVNDGSGNDLDVSSAWTFEAWIKVGSYTSLAYDCIMDRRTVFSFYLVDDDDDDYALTFAARNSSDNIIASMDCDGSGSTSANMSFGVWYHVAATYDGATARLYVNGTEYDSDTDVDWPLTASSNAVNLGGRYWGSYSRQMSDAQIDEIRISNVARSIEQMQTAVSDPAYEVDGNTVLLMHLDDQADPPTYVSGTGLDGSSGDTGITSIDYVDVSNDLSLPVELNYFSGKSTSSGIVLSWETASEVENLGYLIQRHSGDNKESLEVASYSKHPELAGQGSTTEAHTYTWTDTDVEAGVSYRYTLVDVDYQGKQTAHKEIEVVYSPKAADLKPVGFTLSSVFPNPFNPSTSVRFELPEAGVLNIVVHNARGQLVQKLAIDRHFNAGENAIQWDAQAAPAGIYFITLSGMGQTLSSKVVKLN